MNVQKEAARDAYEFARASVFYGEGAGNRRKLIKTAVAAKVAMDPAYARAFEQALARQDMVHHVQKARRERHRRDVFHAVNKNTRNAMAGRYTGVNTAVIVLGTAGYFAHKNGYDKIVFDKAKVKYDRFRTKVRGRFHRVAEVVADAAEAVADAADPTDTTDPTTEPPTVPPPRSASDPSSVTPLRPPTL
jgi:hypothetical protein